MSGKKHSSCVSVLLLLFSLIKGKKKKKIQPLVGILTGGLPTPRDLFWLGIYPFSGPWDVFCPDGFEWRSFLLLCSQVLDGNISMKRRVCPACQVQGRWLLGCNVTLVERGTHTHEWQDSLSEECSAKLRLKRRNWKMEINSLGGNSK